MNKGNKIKKKKKDGQQLLLLGSDTATNKKIPVVSDNDSH